MSKKTTGAKEVTGVKENPVVKAIPEIKKTEKQSLGESLDSKFKTFADLKSQVGKKDFNDPIFTQILTLAVQGWGKLENRGKRIKGGKGSPAWEDETVTSLKDLESQVDQGIELLTLINNR